MKNFARILYVLAFSLGAFGFWGGFTKTGSAHYDEMDGMIPFFALVAGGAVLLIALVLSAVLYFKSRNRVSKK